MTFSLSILLYVYLAFLFVWFVFSIIGIYHMLKFGFINFMTFISVIFYIVISLILLLVSFDYIAQINWDTNITIFSDMLERNNNFF